MLEFERMEDSVATGAAWRELIAKYKKPVLMKSVWQLVNTLVPYLAIVTLMYFSLNVSYWLTLALAVPAAGFMVRMFIISHDCGHRSFFKSKRANDFWGMIAATLVWTPYAYWRNEHARHHSTSGNLDRRGTGDIWTLTVGEYLALPWYKRVGYRLYRNPIVLFVLAPLFMFTLRYRFSSGWAGQVERRSVIRTNLLLLAVLLLAHLTIGIGAFLMIQMPVITLGSAVGIWMFYVQHQFEDVYWANSEDWDFFRQAIEGSSYYKLPKVLQWFTGNIGFHHVHHLSPRIPNYFLEKCHRELAFFSRANRITLLTSLKSMGLRLWDEKRRCMVGFSAARTSASSASG